MMWFKRAKKVLIPLESDDLTHNDIDRILAHHGVVIRPEKIPSSVDHPEEQKMYIDLIARRELEPKECLEYRDAVESCRKWYENVESLTGPEKDYMMKYRDKALDGAMHLVRYIKDRDVEIGTAKRRRDAKIRREIKRRGKKIGLVKVVTGAIIGEGASYGLLETLFPRLGSAIKTTIQIITPAVAGYLVWRWDENKIDRHYKEYEIKEEKAKRTFIRKAKQNYEDKIKDAADLLGRYIKDTIISIPQKLDSEKLYSEAKRI